MKELQFYVPGIPQPGGSKRGFVNKDTGKVSVVDSNKNVYSWRAAVAQAAMEAFGDAPLLTEALAVRFQFIFTRPKGHFGSGKNAGVLKKSAAPYPAGRPDVLKCSRAAEDALTGVIWRDDAQIVTEVITKRYGEHAGAWVMVREQVEG